jgi:hypothetical protein
MSEFETEFQNLVVSDKDAYTNTNSPHELRTHVDDLKDLTKPSSTNTTQSSHKHSAHHPQPHQTPDAPQQDPKPADHPSIIPPYNLKTTNNPSLATKDPKMIHHFGNEILPSLGNAVHSDAINFPVLRLHLFDLNT